MIIGQLYPLILKVLILSAESFPYHYTIFLMIFKMKVCFQKRVDFPTLS
ncbi:hypothetical protein PNI0009_00908 [Streptococcus pneumoniae PNI0009]|nr:hypothetical protein PNI0009_00908 [Streptococcus pneumoniae PNI0009]